MSTLVATNVNARKVEASDIITVSGTLKLPNQNTGNRQPSAETGVLIYNATTNNMEVWSGSQWSGIGGGPLPNWTINTRPATGTGNAFWGWNTDTNRLELWDSGMGEWLYVQFGGSSPGTSADNPAADAMEIYNANNSFADGLYYITTPNGGVQQIYCINDASRGWMVMGKFASDASDTVAGTIETASGTIDNNTGRRISSDFGDGTYTYQRFIGTNDITTWNNSRNIDWYYGIPSGRTWKRFWSNGNANGMDNNRRYGFTTTGVFDGRGRWTNNGYTFMQMSDGQTTISESYFTSPSNSLYFHNASDAKFAGHANSSTSGQDESNTMMFGYDDGNRAFFDDYPGTVGNNSNRRDYSTAVFVLLS